MTTYPAKIDNNVTLPIAVDNSTPIKASLVNQLRSAILAIESELGVKPSGVYGTVKARIEALENELTNSNFVELDGDLGGTTTSPLVIGLQGLPISNQVPTSDQVLTWSGLAWVPADSSGGAMVSTIPWKASVRVVAVTNLTTSGLQTIDGETLVGGDRILLTAQTNPVNNGIYIVNSGAWTRSSDMANASTLELGTFIKIMEGSTYSNILFELSAPTDGIVTIGTTALTWTQYIPSTGSVDTLTGNTITIENGIGTDYIHILQTTSDIGFRLADAANSFTLGWIQESSGAGKATTITGQQGQAGNIGGSVTIRSGRGGTGGTNLGGNIVLDLAQQVSGNTDYLYISENNTPFLGLRRSTTTANFVVQGTTTDVGWAQDNFILRTAAASTKLTTNVANAFAWTYDSAVTGVTNSITKRTGTGANAGAARTLSSQDGQNVAGGTNNNGGALTLNAGDRGTGGTGGAGGSINLNTFNTGDINLVSTGLVRVGLNSGGTTTATQTLISASTSITVSTIDTILSQTTMHYRNASATEKLTVTIADAFVENYALGVTVDSQINTVSRHLISATGNTFGGAVRYNTDISPTSISSNQTDYNPTNWNIASRIRQAVGTSCVINSAAAGSNGERKVIENISTTNYLTLLHDDGATGTAAQRFLCANGVSRVIPPLGSATIEYDTTSSRWRVISVSAGTNLSGADYAYTGSLTIDFTVNNIARVGALTGNITVNAPTGGISGPLYVVSMAQDGTGGRTVAWNAAFVFSEGYGVICPTASSLTTWVFVYNPATTNFRCISRAYDLGNNGIVSFSSGSPTLVPGKINILSGTVTNPVIPAGSGWAGGFNAITIKLNNLTGGCVLQRSGSDTLNGGTTYTISEVYGQAVLISTGTTDVLVSPGLT